MSDPRNDHQNEVPAPDSGFTADPDLAGGGYAGESPVVGADDELMDEGLFDEDPDLGRVAKAACEPVECCGEAEAGVVVAGEFV